CWASPFGNTRWCEWPRAPPRHPVHAAGRYASGLFRRRGYDAATRDVLDVIYDRGELRLDQVLVLCVQVVPLARFEGELPRFIRRGLPSRQRALEAYLVLAGLHLDGLGRERSLIVDA